MGRACTASGEPVSAGAAEGSTPEVRESLSTTNGLRLVEPSARALLLPGKDMGGDRLDEGVSVWRFQVLLLLKDLTKPLRLVIRRYLTME